MAFILRHHADNREIICQSIKNIGHLHTGRGTMLRKEEVKMKMNNENERKKAG